jgi:hypothetical protein
MAKVDVLPFIPKSPVHALSTFFLLEAASPSWIKLCPLSHWQVTFSPLRVIVATSSPNMARHGVLALLSVVQTALLVPLRVIRSASAGHKNIDGAVLLCPAVQAALVGANGIP